MSRSARTDAIETIADRVPGGTFPPATVSLEEYGCDVFNHQTMRKYLSAGVAAKLLATIDDGAALDPAIADDVAHAMKDWALDRGATHFTHWFLPLNGSTAEKHDSFLELQGEKPLMKFSGKNLIVGEPDASSFPSGGLRCTFEARGYTAWDPTSPAFIKRHANGATLCIPTAFCSYTGEALDKKTPLLRSRQALTAAVKRLMACFGLPEKRVTVTLGAEQEYFLIDRRFYLQRPDLVQTGRTLFGAPPAKHQQLEDHYFGSIRARVLNFMNEVEQELWKLGIPAKTRHNEAAPAQFELAPIFEDVNLACDHNMLTMEVLRQTAERYGFVCLMHEKPFAGVNGSGKHNNWSVSYGDVGLLNPGKDPEQNAIFLTFLTAVIAAVDRHAALLRATVAGAGNDHRLGASEAPPAIVSIYLGDQLTGIIEALEKGASGTRHEARALRIGVDTLPPLPQDATDRNRTSPFAFTGNKFEFRAPGASQCCSGPCTALNAIVAETVNEMADELEKAAADGKDFHDALQELLRKLIREHKRVLFSGDNYTAEWRAEAARRGLPERIDTPAALTAFSAPETLEVFARTGVFSKIELASRQEVFVEEYQRRIAIEGGIALEIARSMILPAAIAELSASAAALEKLQHSGVAAGVEGVRVHVEEIGRGVDDLSRAIAALADARQNCFEKLIPAMQELRRAGDWLERRVADERWPLPKYREMLFVY